MADGLLVPVFFSVLLAWAVLGAAVAGVYAIRSWRDGRLRRAVAWLNHSSSQSPRDVAAALDGLIGRLPATFLIARLADPSIPDACGRALCVWLAGHSRGRLVACASTTKRRSAGCRAGALRVLVRAGCDEALPLLERALADGDPQLVGVAVNLLGSLSQRRAALALIGALRAGRFQASRIATALDRFPLPIADLLSPLAADPNPIARFWGATLLSRYGNADGVADEVAGLVRDANPQVRKAAIETLGALGGAPAAKLALGLLGDPVWYVRAHAARALGDLGRTDLAEHVLALLADRHWWVRQAAKESLEKMGPGVWRDVIKCLDHADPFARNAAAEVLQNLGVLDSLVVLEATSEHPAPEKIDALRKIAAAGGVRMTNALLERADAHLAQRIRALLDTLGLRAAGI